MLFWMSVVFINIEMNDFLNKFISFDIHLGHIDLTTLKIDKQLLRFLLEEAHNLKPDDMLKANIYQFIKSFIMIIYF